MFYEFKQSVRIDKKTFLKGTHEVPEEIVSHPHFAKYVDYGMIAVGEPPKKKMKGESFADRNKELSDRLKAKLEHLHEQVQEKEPESPVETEEPEAEELTPAQKAAATRKANAEKAEAEKAKK